MVAGVVDDHIPIEQNFGRWIDFFNSFGGFDGSRFSGAVKACSPLACWLIQQRDRRLAWYLIEPVEKREWRTGQRSKRRYKGISSGSNSNTQNVITALARRLGR